MTAGHAMENAAGVRAVLLLVLLAGCGARPGAERTLLPGDTVPLGARPAHAWVALDDAGRPAALGVSLSPEAPGSGARTGPEGIPPGAHRLRLPRVPGLAFDHAELEFHAAGHRPSGLYDRPHLDVRFFLAGGAQREGFTDTLAAARMPPLAAVPKAYVPLPSFRPRIGAYWIDPTSPPFDGEPLRAGLAYGFYDGRLVFVELKLDAALLDTPGDHAWELAPPEIVPAPGFYPTRWSLSTRRGEVRIALTALQRRE